MSFRHINLDNLTDVNVVGADNNDVLTYVAASGEWFALPSSGGSIGDIALSELTDVLIDAVASGEYLMYNGDEWINAIVLSSGEGVTDHAELDNLDYAAAGHTGFSPTIHNHDEAYSAIGHNHDLLYAASGHNHDDAYSALGHAHALDDLTDVAIITPSSGDSLMYDGDGWVNSYVSREHVAASGSSPQIANLVFGTGDPPNASSVPEGTIWIKYTG